MNKLKHFIKLLVFLIVAVGCCLGADNLAALPPALQEALSAAPYASQYDVDLRINPVYLRGDFDLDGLPDCAVLISEKGTRARGIAVWLSSSRRLIILGAGTPVRYGATRQKDLNFNNWLILSPKLLDNSSMYELPTGVKSDCLLVEVEGSAGGLYYWNKKAGIFQWHQEGD